MGPLVGAIRLPDGPPVRGRGRREPLPAGPLPEHALHLGSPPSPHRAGWHLPGRADRPVDRPVDWPVEWIDWPDFRVPRDDVSAAAAIERAYLLARGGRLVEVTCGGGNGRTGTVIACMAVLAGHPADDAVAWTRRNYRRHAVETPGQRQWVRRFARDHAP